MGVFNLFKKKKEEQEKQPTSRFIDDEWLEVNAATKEEAIERACVALNTNPSHLEIKPLSKDGKKFRARKTTEVQESSENRAKKSPVKASNYETQEDTDETQLRSRGNSRGGDRYEEDTEEGRTDTRSPRREREPAREVIEEVEEETDLGRKAKAILLEIVIAIEPNALVELYETNKTVRLEILSKESGLFIGKFGQTLDAIQHLLKKMLELKQENGKHLVVDAEDYRIRREESIESKARKLAKKARQERRPVSIEPMNAMDRRIVHMALEGEPGIETKSVGEGPNRRVLIVPKGVRTGPSRGGRGGSRDGGGGGGRGRGGYESRGRGRPPGNRDGNTRPRDPNARIHDSYDVPAQGKSEVFGDNPEEYFEGSSNDEDK